MRIEDALPSDCLAPWLADTASLIQATTNTVLGPPVAELAASRLAIERQADALRALERENGSQAAEREPAASAVVVLGEEVERLRQTQSGEPIPESAAAVQDLWARTRRLPMIPAALIMVVVLLALPR